MQRAAPLLLSVILLASTTSIEAQTLWERQVQDQITAASTLFGSDGYRLAGETRTGALQEGASEGFAVQLEGETTYAFVAVCDADCTNIDLSVTDESGSVLGSDFEDDDIPLVEFTPSASGSYRILVHMKSCAAAPCYYGVGMYSGEDGASAWYTQIDEQLATAGELFAAEGYEPEGDVVRGSLEQGGAQRFTVVLEEGGAYAFVGVCDTDCSDIDLMISDSGGQKLDVDFEEDDVPILEMAPGRSGMYTLEVRMAGCEREPCYFGVASYRSTR